MALQYGQAIYYPHVHFRSRAWLRTAALYYDSITRIVPNGLIPYDRLKKPDRWYTGELEALDDVRALQDAGFVRDEDPHPVVEKVGNEFREFALTVLRDEGRRKKLLPELYKGEPIYTIHPAKIDPGLLTTLKELRLARLGVGGVDGDWELDSVTGAFYMLLLAERMANNRPLVSDNAVYQSLTQAPLPNRSEANNKSALDSGFVTASAVMDSVIPTNIASIPIKTLIKFRQEHEEERRSFYDAMAKLTKDMENIHTLTELREVVDAHEKTVSTNVNNLKRKLRNININCAIGAFAVSPPSVVTASWGLSSTNPYVLAGTGALVLCGALVKSTLDRKAARAESPWAYLLSVRRNFKAQRVAREIILLNLNRKPNYTMG